MARVDVNRFGEMDMFVRVVERGGFSPAARDADLTASAVSKLIARMEARLGARLILRTTRKFALTPEGEAYYTRAVQILADLAEAETAAGDGERPVGGLRVNSSASYACHVLAPILPGFLDRYPQISVEIVQSDTVIDLVKERADIAIRAGPMPSSGLMARKLGSTRLTIAAAPSWIDRHGLPDTIEALSRHERIGFNYARAVKGWPLMTGKGSAIMLLPAVGRLQASDGEGIRQLALAGAGPARLAAFTIRDDIAAGRLVPILEAANPGDLEAFHAVFVGGSTALPARARAMLDYLAEHGRVG